MSISLLLSKAPLAEAARCRKGDVGVAEEGDGTMFEDDMAPCTDVVPDRGMELRYCRVSGDGE